MALRYLQLFSLILLLLRPEAVLAGGTFRFGGDHEFEPYEFKNADGNPDGINVDLARAIGGVMGFTTQSVIGDWTEIRRQFDEDQIDVINMYRSPEREKLYDFSSPHAIFNHVIVTRKPSRQLSSLGDLKDLEIILSRNTYSDEVLHQLYPDYKFFDAKSELDALRDLASGLHDVAIVSQTTAEKSIEAFNLELVVTGPPLLPIEYCFAVKKNNPELLARLNKGLAIIKQNGSYQDIRDNWLGARINTKKVAAWSTSALLLVLLIVAGILLWNRGLTRQVEEKTRSMQTELDGRVKAEWELKQSFHLLDSIINGIRDPIVVKKTNGEYYLANQAALKALGLRSSGIIGKTDRDIFSADLYQSIETQDRQIVESGKELLIEESGKINGEEVAFQKFKFPARDSTGAIFGVIGIHRDITQELNQKREKDALLAQELSARQEAERLIRVKDEFLLTLTHELKTPLAVIVGWSELLLADRSLSEKHRSSVEVIDRNGRAELQLINDLLESTAIMTGNLSVNLQPMDANKTVQRTVESLLPVAAAKGIDLSFSTMSATSLINGDEPRIQQIVWNLLTNAIKFNGPGGWIRVSLLQSKGMLEIAIEDNGVGIDPEFIEVAFLKFNREQTELSRQSGGLGIGLTLSQELVELHGGTITAVSAGKDKGATFTVRLPLV